MLLGCGYVAHYNHQWPQSALDSKTPMQTMKERHPQHPQLVHKRPYSHGGIRHQTNTGT